MIRGSKILAVIPARGGSKGMIKKDLRKIDNVPLVTLAAQVASQSLYVDDLVVSTDCEEIGIAAKNGGAKFDFIRPEHLSGDQIADLPVLKHSLETSESLQSEIRHHRNASTDFSASQKASCGLGYRATS